MISLSQSQVSNIEQAIAQKFAHRVIAAVERDYADVCQLTQNERDDLILVAIDEAKNIHITVEQDVFDYVLLSLVVAAPLLTNENIKERQWLESPHVPSAKKIQRIRGWLNE